MKPAPFAYRRPETMQDALALLAEHADDAQILAGGQSLVPMLNLRMAAPAVLIDINRLPDLGRIEETEAGLTVGACVRHAALLEHARTTGAWPLVAEAIPHVAHPGIRNRGTLCGSLALADPAAEAPAYAVALDARIHLQSAHGRREIPAFAFFTGVYETARAPDEMIVAAFFPRPHPDWRFAFREVARRRGDYAMAGICAAIRLRERLIDEARLVFFGIAEAPIRAARAEALLAGAGLGDRDAWAAAAHAACEELPAMPGGEAGTAFKKHLAGVLIARTLAELDAREPRP